MYTDTHERNAVYRVHIHDLVTANEPLLGNSQSLYVFIKQLLW